LSEILVTGGSGYVGSHVVRMLIEHGYQPVVVDLRADSRLWAHPECRAYQGDVRDANILNAIALKHRISAIIHLAASSEVGPSVTNPLAYYDNNINGTRQIIQFANWEGIGKIIFSSTSSVYGEIDPSQLPTKEHYAKNPATSYGASKLTAEYMLRDAEIAYGIKSVSLRYFNASGAWPDGTLGEFRESPTHLIPSIQQAYDIDNDFTINGVDYTTPDGSAVRDFTHVWDIAAAHVNALKYLEAGGNTDQFNIGAGAGKSVLEIINEYQEQMDQALLIKVGSRRPGDIPINYADITKAKKLLGWEPKMSNCQSIVKDAIRWYSSDLYKSL